MSKVLTLRPGDIVLHNKRGSQYRIIGKTTMDLADSNPYEIFKDGDDAIFSSKILHIFCQKSGEFIEDFTVEEIVRADLYVNNGWSEYVGEDLDGPETLRYEHTTVMLPVKMQISNPDPSEEWVLIYMNEHGVFVRPQDEFTEDRFTRIET